MRTETALRAVARRPAAPPAPVAPTADPEPLGSALLDAGSLELLILNEHASLGVHTRSQFFVWTQGLLQGLLAHRVLICLLRGSEPAVFRGDAFSTSVPAAGALAGQLLRDAAVLPGLVRAWRQHRYLPLVCDADDPASPSCGGFARELARIGAPRLLVHGSLDPDGQACGMYLFACAASQAAADPPYLMQLIVPFLHAAWVRCQAVAAEAGAPPARVSSRVLTAREREILRWICHGKSNGEIGAILGISPMTVKNHVQKILRKLNVVNRAQAVGKALDAQLIAP